MHLLEQIRDDHNLTKTQMAKRLGIAKSYYSMIIRSDAAVSKNVAVKIYKAFGVPLEELLCRPVVQSNGTATG